MRDVEENGLFLGKFEFGYLFFRGVATSTQVIGVCFTPMELRKPRTPRESSLARAASASFWRGSKALRWMTLPIGCWTSYHAGRLGPGADLDDDITLVALHVKGD